MKKGTIVKIIDGSYMFTIIDGKPTHSGKGNEKTIGHSTDKYEVIEGDYFINYGYKLSVDNRRIDTVIQNIKTKSVWYCCSDVNIREAYNEIPRYSMDELKNIVGHEFLIK